MQVASINIFNLFGGQNPFLPLKNEKKADVSFGRYGMDGGKVQRFFDGFPCPCCGIPMLSFKKIKQPLNMPDTTPAEQIIPILEKYKNNMHPVEREVFDIMKSLAKDYPKKNLRELLDTQRENYLEILHFEQLDILRRLRFMSQFLLPEEEVALAKTLNETEQILNDKTSNEQFKRRIFVGKVKYTAENFKDKGVVKRIFKIAEEMPKASNNTAAFIVKYTEKKPATGKERTSSDIVWGLLFPSIGTIEHIRPRTKRVRHGGGKDKMSNFILECARDNNDRSCMPLYVFAKQHPDYYGGHLQLFINLAAEKIKKQGATDFVRYPQQVIKTLRKESKGRINAHIPKIDIKNA